MAKKYLLLAATDALQEGDEWWAGPNGWLPCSVFRQLSHWHYRRPVDEVPPGRYEAITDGDVCVGSGFEWLDFERSVWRTLHMGDSCFGRLVRRLVPATDRPKQYLILDPSDDLLEGDEWWDGPNGWVRSKDRSPKRIANVAYRRAVDVVPVGRYRLLGADEAIVAGDEWFGQIGGCWYSFDNKGDLPGERPKLVRRLVQPTESMPAQYQLLDATDESRSGDEYFIHSTQRWALVGPYVTKDAHIRRRRVEGVPPGEYRLLGVSEPSQDGDEVFLGSAWAPLLFPKFSQNYVLRRRLVPHEIDRGGVKRYQFGEEFFFFFFKALGYEKANRALVEIRIGLEGRVSELERELAIYKGMYRSRQAKHLKLVDALKSFTGGFDELNNILSDEV